MGMEMLSLLGVLGALSVEDIKKKKVSIVVLALAGIAGILMHLQFARISIWNILGGVTVGAVMYGVSILSREKIGKGDAILIAVTGIYLGFWGNIILLWVSSVLAGMGGVFALVLLKKGREFEIPFIPFVFVAYIGCIILWKGQLI